MKILIILLFFWCKSAYAGFFAEGHSSPEPDAPARLESRVFTIHTLADACQLSPMPYSMTVAPANITLSSGDKIFRGERTSLRVIAKDANHDFIPSIPITIDIPPSDDYFFWGLSALDYVEAIKQGTTKLVVKSLCHDSVPSAEIKVTISGNAPVTPGYCAYYIDQETQIRGEKWKFAGISSEVFDAATRAGVNPRVTTGDFDNDSIADTAYLIQRNDGNKEIAVCLSTHPRPVLYINDLYCDDSIDTTDMGTSYYDYDRDAYGEYNRDGIRVNCFERAGATYLYDDGQFQRIVDSD